MAFFPEQEPKLDQECLVWATRLYTVVKRMGKVRTWNNKNWTKIFVQLRNKHGAEAVTACLDWYERNAGGEYVPVCNSAVMFYNKFLQVKAGMERSRADECNIIADQWDVETAEAMLNSFSLPIEIAARLPQIIHQTRENWRDFIKKLQDFKIRSFSATSREFGFLTHIQANTVLFPVAWVEHFARAYGNLRSYTGRLDKLTFIPESERFRNGFWHEWSYEWCGVAMRFDWLLDKILAEEKS